MPSSSSGRPSNAQPTTDGMCRSPTLTAMTAAGIDHVSGGRFEVMPKTEPRTGGRLVRTKVFDVGGRETAVDYLVNQEDKVADLYLSGTVSELAALRSQFDPVLKSGGPDGLEANLRQRAEKALGGT